MHISKQKLNFYHFIPLIVGILFFLYIVFYYYLPKNYPNITLPLDPNCEDKTNRNRCQNPNNRLNWTWPHSWYIYSFIISLIILLIFIKPLKLKIWLILIFGLTFIYYNIFNRQVVGSLWCFSAAILAPLIVLISYFIIKDMNSKDILC